MSRRLIDRNRDLRQLRDEGYDIEVRHGHLLVKGVPYLDARGEVRRGTLVAPLGDMSGDLLQPPGDHTICFAGDHPCDQLGREITQIKNSSRDEHLAEGVTIQHRFSAKPKPDGRYRDYHHKVTTYLSLISAPVHSVDPAATAQTCAVVVPDEGASVFNYADTASTRAGIAGITAKIQGQKLGIVGVGGTGSYILDLVAKTPVAEIHVFDGDAFLNHNAFRAPGAPSIEDLRARPTKVAYFCAQYTRMHRGIIAHETFLDDSNIEELRGLDFVFVCVDRGPDRRRLVERLRAWKIPFIDVGLGVNEAAGTLRGQVRVTMCTPVMSDHIGIRIPTTEGDRDNEYSRNIQIAELNALNAALAVIRWKKWCGFYLDQDREHYCLYTIDGNRIDNEELECAPRSDPSSSSSSLVT